MDAPTLTIRWYLVDETDPDTLVAGTLEDHLGEPLWGDAWPSLSGLEAVLLGHGAMRGGTRDRRDLILALRYPDGYQSVRVEE